MSMSSHIMFLRDDDEEHRKMVAVNRACKAAKVPVPKEVAEYFPEGTEDSALEIRANDEDYEWSSQDSGKGFEVDLAKLPNGVKRIRFFNCW